MTNEEFKELEEKYHAELERRKAKMRLELMLKDLEYAKEGGNFNSICLYLLSEEQEKLYVFLKNMFEEELKEFEEDEKL